MCIGEKLPRGPTELKWLLIDCSFQGSAQEAQAVHDVVKTEEVEP